jgi:outer membrane murein-binding lipoprotein Lpp
MKQTAKKSTGSKASVKQLATKAATLAARGDQKASHIDTIQEQVL